MSLETELKSEWNIKRILEWMDEYLADADVVVVAVPLGAMATVFSAIKGNLKSGAVLTDEGEDLFSDG